MTAGNECKSSRASTTSVNSSDYAHHKPFAGALGSSVALVHQTSQSSAVHPFLSSVYLKQDTPELCASLPSRNGEIDSSVLNSIRFSNRGKPLNERDCQGCLDVARNCPLDLQCPCLAKKIQSHLMICFPELAELSEMQMSVFRFIKEEASLGDIRAKQVMRTQLQPASTGVVSKVKEHSLAVQKLKWCKSNLREGKTVERVRREAQAFLQSLQTVSKDADIAALIEMFKTIARFEPFLAKTREKAAAIGKKSFHAESDAVEEFCKCHKLPGDKCFTSGMLLLSCKLA